MIVGFQGTPTIAGTNVNWWNTKKNVMTCAGLADQQIFMNTAAIAASRTMGYADSQEWKAAVDEDSCVATQLALQSYESAFAEAVLVNMYKRLNGVYPTYTADQEGNTSDWSCLSQQLSYLDSLPLFDESFTGNTCAIPNGPKAPQSLPPAELSTPIQYGGGYHKIRPSPGATPAVRGWSLAAAPPAGTPSPTGISGPSANLLLKEMTAAPSSTETSSLKSVSTTSTKSVNSDDNKTDHSAALHTPSTATASSQVTQALNSTATSLASSDSTQRLFDSYSPVPTPSPAIAMPLSSPGSSEESEGKQESPSTSSYSTVLQNFEVSSHGSRRMSATLLTMQLVVAVGAAILGLYNN